jgi:hypothetical protein
VPAGATSAKDEVYAFLAAHFPRVSHPGRYGVLDSPAPVSVHLRANVEHPDDDPRYGIAIAALAVQVFELAFPEGHTGFLYATKEGDHGAALPPDAEPPALEPSARLDLAAFDVPLHAGPVDLGDLPVLCSMLPDRAVRSAGLRCGVNLHGSYRERYAELHDDEEPDHDIPYAELVVPVEPCLVDHVRLLGALADRDFPRWDRPRLAWDVLVLDVDDPAIFDMYDDRYCGVGAPRPDRVRDLYVAAAEMLNSYRRPEMEAAFGFWPGRTT